MSANILAHSLVFWGSQGDALNAILDDDIIHSRFSVLDHTLIKLSFEVLIWSMYYPYLWTIFSWKCIHRNVLPFYSEELNFWGCETNFVRIINIWDKLFTMSRCAFYFFSACPWFLLNILYRNFAFRTHQLSSVSMTSRKIAPFFFVLSN